MAQEGQEGGDQKMSPTIGSRLLLHRLRGQEWACALNHVHPGNGFAVVCFSFAELGRAGDCLRGSMRWRWASPTYQEDPSALGGKERTFMSMYVHFPI